MSLHPSARLESFRHAFRGIGMLLVSTPNAWIHAAATVLVFAAGAWLGLDRDEWQWVVLAMGLVWAAEALNTAVEELGDAVTTDHHPKIGRAKDVAAGGVLLAAIAAAIIGLLVFVPRLLARWSS